MVKPSITWTVKRFVNGCAILVGSGQTLEVPRHQMPPNVREGDELTADFYLVKDEKKRRDNLAKALLDEILGNDG